MTHLGLKLSVAGAFLVCALAYLGFAGMQNGWVYQMTVDQYVANSEQVTRVRLCGTAGAEGLEVNKAQLTARFVIKGAKASMPVLYKGVIPDMFKAGSDVVVEGKKDAAGVFQADLLMTKCASKYEAQPAGHPGRTNQSPDYRRNTEAEGSATDRHGGDLKIEEGAG